MEAITATPPSHKSEPTHLIKSASRLAQMKANAVFGGEENDQEIPHFSVEFAPSPSPPPPPTNRKTPSSTPSKLSIRPRNCLPLHELLLLSPPVRKSKTRLSDCLETVDDSNETRRRCKTRTSGNGLPGYASPRNLRRSRRRIETEDREFVQVDEMGVKPRKRRASGGSKKEKTNLVASNPSSNNFPKENDGEGSAFDRVGLIIWDLVMWRDVAKSSLWFGFGCLCFLSSCFTKGLNISLFSVTSQLGLLILAASFISHTLHQQRGNIPSTREAKLKEDDIMRVIRLVLPALNLALSKTREIFSGEPSMTLKVATYLLFGAEYGHFLTLRRLFALGFFTSFTFPKLYSSYSAQIHNGVEQYKWRILEAWRACAHKRVVAMSVATAFWNLSCLRTRVFAAFISLVILRYYRQHSEPQSDKSETVTVQEEVQPQRQAPTTTEGEKGLEQALVLQEENTLQIK